VANVKKNVEPRINWSLWTGLALLALWVVVALVIAWPSGWAHVPLAAGFVLVAKGIVEADRRE
jgi:hypothetical protein